MDSPHYPLEGNILCQVDDLLFELRQEHDFSWLSQYGTAFCVFDHLITGNLCFGVDGPKGKLFIKYAGAATTRYSGSQSRAISRLMEASDRYFELSHPALTRALSCFETDSGFACVFEWFEGCPLSSLKDEFRSLQTLPVFSRLRSFDSICDFVTLASAKDYACLGFSDRHLLINMDSAEMRVCSLDDYRLMPCMNTRGRIPGDVWYIPPEGYERTAMLDEQTAVFALGILAFTLFGNRVKPSLQTWQCGKELFNLALSAIHPDRRKRPLSSLDFLTQWRDGVRRLTH